MICLLLLKVSIIFSLKILYLFTALPGGLNRKAQKTLLIQPYIDQVDIHLA